MKTQSLKNSIENLYSAFAKYPLKKKIEGCSCCVSKQAERVLHLKPLRQMSGEDLSFYGFKAMTTFGDVEDFKHFLPRLFELAVENELDFDEATLFDKLEWGKWENWSENEKSAIENFFFELFRCAVNLENDEIFLVENYLVGIANAVEDVTPYLDLWLEEISTTKILTLNYFVIECDYGMSSAFLADHPEQRKQIINWLISEKTISVLESLHSNREFKKSRKLKNLLEAIHKMKNS